MALEGKEGLGLARSYAGRPAKLLVGGASAFLILPAAVQVALSLVGAPPDATFYRLYPLMAALGAAFGFERWWGQEQGEYHPFHDT